MHVDQHEVVGDDSVLQFRRQRRKCIDHAREHPGAENPRKHVVDCQSHAAVVDAVDAARLANIVGGETRGIEGGGDTRTQFRGKRRHEQVTLAGVGPLGTDGRAELQDHPVDRVDRRIEIDGTDARLQAPVHLRVLLRRFDERLDLRRLRPLGERRRASKSEPHSEKHGRDPRAIPRVRGVPREVMSVPAQPRHGTLNALPVAAAFLEHVAIDGRGQLPVAAVGNGAGRMRARRLVGKLNFEGGLVHGLLRHW